MSPKFVCSCLSLVAILFTAQASAASDRGPAESDTVKQQAGDTSGFAVYQDWTQRRIVGLIFSTIIPGSGQSYLGHTEKGAAFTLAAFGSALVAGLSESNVIGRNERLDELRGQYQLATSYIGADSTWSKMVETKAILDKEVRRRDLFVKLAVALWLANVLDYIFLTTDKGEKTFGFLPGKENSFALVPDSKNGVNAQLSIRF